jgi:hypothetical protein
MKNIFKSLSAFQKECPVIHKGTSGYGYSYADLPAIFEVINPLLEKHGLGFTQPICGTKVKTTLFHIETGETIESETDIPQGVQLAKMNDFQVLGSAITYIRRYALTSMLGVISDKDIDAAGEQVKVKKPLLNQSHEKWNSAIEAIKEGKTTLSKVAEVYDVTELQKHLN